MQTFEDEPTLAIKSNASKLQLLEETVSKLSMLEQSELLLVRVRDVQLVKNADRKTFVDIELPTTRSFIGNGFVLLRLGRDAPAGEGLQAAAAERGVPCRVVDLDAPEVLAAYQRRLVLVRPDGHVAWRGDAEPANARAVIDRVRGAGPIAKGAHPDLEVAS